MVKLINKSIAQLEQINSWFTSTPLDLFEGLEPKLATVLSALLTVSNNIFLALKSNSSFLKAVSRSHVLVRHHEVDQQREPQGGSWQARVFLEEAFNDLSARRQRPLNGGNEVTINFCHCYGTPFNNHDREQMRCEIDSVIKAL